MPVLYMARSYALRRLNLRYAWSLAEVRRRTESITTGLNPGMACCAVKAGLGALLLLLLSSLRPGSTNPEPLPLEKPLDRWSSSSSSNSTTPRLGAWNALGVEKLDDGTKSSSSSSSTPKLPLEPKPPL